MELKIACVGTSPITIRTLEVIRSLKGVSARAAYSRSLEKAKALALPRAYDDFSALLADDDIDLLYIASPNSLHAEQAKAALEAGKHVVLEKPFVQDPKDAKALFSLADARGVYLFEAITTLHLPVLDYVKRRLPEFGRIRHVSANFSQYSSRYTSYLQGEISNIFNPAFGGGALGDLNIYNLHAVVALFGAPEKAHYFPNKGRNGVDTSGTAVLCYPDFQALCFAGKDCDGQSYFSIQGEAAQLFSHDKSSMLTEMQCSLADFTPPAQPLSPYEYEWRAIVRCIKEQRRDEYRHWQNECLEVMRVYAELKDGL